MSTQISALLGRAIALLDPRQPALHRDRARVVAHVAEQRDERAQRGHVLRIALQHLLVRRDRALQESALPEVGGEVGEARDPLVAVEVAPEQQVLVQPDRAADVAAHPVEAREREVGLHAARVELRARDQQLLGALVVAVEHREQRGARGGLRVARCRRSAPAQPAEHRISRPTGGHARRTAHRAVASGRLRSWWISASSPPTALR